MGMEESDEAGEDLKEASQVLLLPILLCELLSPGTRAIFPTITGEAHLALLQSFSKRHGVLPRCYSPLRKEGQKWTKVSFMLLWFFFSTSPLAQNIFRVVFPYLCQ